MITNTNKKNLKKHLVESIVVIQVLSLILNTFAVAEVIDRSGGRLESIVSSMINQAQDLQEAAFRMKPMLTQNEAVVRDIQKERALLNKIDPHYDAKSLELNLAEQRTNEASMQLESEIRENLQKFVEQIGNSLVSIREEVNQYKSTEGQGDNDIQHAQLRRLLSETAITIQAIIPDASRSKAAQSLIHLANLNKSRCNFNKFIEEFQAGLERLHQDLALKNQQIFVERADLKNMRQENEWNQKQTLLMGTLVTVQGVIEDTRKALDGSDLNKYRTKPVSNKIMVQSVLGNGLSSATVSQKLDEFRSYQDTAN